MMPGSTTITFNDREPSVQRPLFFGRDTQSKRDVQYCIKLSRGRNPNVEYSELWHTQPKLSLVKEETELAAVYKEEGENYKRPFNVLIKASKRFVEGRPLSEYEKGRIIGELYTAFTLKYGTLFSVSRSYFD